MTGQTRKGYVAHTGLRVKRKKGRQKIEAQLLYSSGGGAFRLAPALQRTMACNVFTGGDIVGRQLRHLLPEGETSREAAS